MARTDLRARNRAGRLENSKDAADDEYEEYDIGCPDHAAWDRAEEALETGGARHSVHLVIYKQAFGRDVFFQGAVRVGNNHRTVSPSDGSRFSLVLAGRNDEGQKAADEDHSGEQREHMRDFNLLPDLGHSYFP